MADLEKNESPQNGSKQLDYINDLKRKSSDSSEGADGNNYQDDRRTSVASSKSLLPSKLSLRTKIFYSLGHIYNDLTGSIWFSYTLLFFQVCMKPCHIEPDPNSLVLFFSV